MKATPKKTAKSSKATKSKKEEPKKVSKTWLAMQKNKNGAGGKILDMRAVLK
jgi:hypothetical protein